MKQYWHKPVDQAEIVIETNKEILRAREIRAQARKTREKAQQLRAELQRRQGIQGQRIPRRNDGCARAAC
jgi:hypothetical protein